MFEIHWDGEMQLRVLVRLISPKVGGALSQAGLALVCQQAASKEARILRQHVLAD